MSSSVELLSKLLDFYTPKLPHSFHSSTPFTPNQSSTISIASP